MADIDEFTVQNADLDIKVLCFRRVGTTWDYICTETDCHTVVGYDGPGEVAGGAAQHLRWHADGKRECGRCGSTLGPDDPGTACADEAHCKAVSI